MELFYITAIEYPYCYLSDEEAIHCLKSFRKNIGDTIHLTDGKGNYYIALITHTDKKNNKVTAIIQKQEAHTRTYKASLCIAPTKNTDRMEWLVEKATELGVAEIQWIITQHSQRKNISLDRMQRIAIAAMKQSLQCFLPIIHQIVPFTEWLQKQNIVNGIIGYCGDIPKKTLPEVIQQADTQNTFWLCIGPEGDFTPQEVQIASEKGLIPISIGTHRLRTETAALTALSYFYLYHDY